MSTKLEKMSDPEKALEMSQILSSSTLDTIELFETDPNPSSEGILRHVRSHLHPASSDVVRVDWDGPKDPDNPFNWSTPRKWFITILACFVTFAVSLNGTAIAAGYEAINEQFHVSDASFPNSYWPIASWTLGSAAAPLVGLPLMENFGVRNGYLLIYAVFFLFVIPQAVAENFATLIITRIFAGGCAGILANAAGGIVSDIWDEGMSHSLGSELYIYALLGGFSMGPVIGGAFLKHQSWRWISYGQLIFYGALYPALCLWIPEVRTTVILGKKAKRINQITGKPAVAVGAHKLDFKELALDAAVRPLRMLFTEWVVLGLSIWSAFCIGTVFLFTQSIAQVFTTNYNWDSLQTGAVQVAVVIGMTIGLILSPIQDKAYFGSALHNRDDPGRPIPEARLYLSIPGSFIGLAGGLFLFAWTSYPHYTWLVPAIGLGFVGFGIFVVVTALTNYLLDSYSLYAASSMAAVAFLENIFSAFLPLATQSMYKNLGFQWASSFLGFVAVVLSFIPVVLLFYGKSIRARSPFMSVAARKDMTE